MIAVGGALVMFVLTSLFLCVWRRSRGVQKIDRKKRRVGNQDWPVQTRYIGSEEVSGSGAIAFEKSIRTREWMLAQKVTTLESVPEYERGIYIESRSEWRD